MKNLSTLIYRGCLAAGALLSLLTAMSAAQARDAQSYFPKSDLMTIGSYYYPEQWPEKNWSRDLKNMAKLGFDFTHYAEFAWAIMEPEEGKYDFAWLDQAIKLAADNGLKVVLCTPSPTPPAWLSQKHPEILMANNLGTTIQHGARQQASWSSPVYRQYVEKIVSVMAQRYARNPAVIGWQIDNEPSHYDSAYDYSDAAQRSFRVWLEKKYKTIAALNASWGNAFWSVQYNGFDQIRIPNGKELVAQPNPHAVLDFKRFSADEVASFIKLQNDVLRRHVPEDRWITSNFMTGFTPVDMGRDFGIDFPTYTKYLVAGYDMGHGEQGFRLGSSSSIGWSNDFTRPLKGVSGVMELQPGQVNWGKFNPQTLPGAVRMWIFHAFAGGNSFVANYRFRQPLSGGEQYHYGIMRTDGETLSRSGEEYVQAIGELRALKKQYDPKAKLPAELAARRTAILFNPDNQWEEDNQPQTDRWSFSKHVDRYYRALQSFAAPVDVIRESDDFSGYPVLIAPSYQLLDAALVQRWKAYAEAGGHLVLTSRTGQKDREAHLWEAEFAQPIHELIGARELYYDHLPPSGVGKIKLGAQEFVWSTWADVLTPAGAEVWATYDNQFYAGKAAVLHRGLGRGSVTYIGPDSSDGELEKTALRRVYETAGIGLRDLPEGVVLGWRDGFWVGLNYSSEAQTLPVPAKTKPLIGQAELQPAGVVVWKD